MDATTEALLAALESQRAHVLGVLEQLTPEQQQQPALPTGWTPLAMVQHLALDVERFWFRVVLTGELPMPDVDGWVVTDPDSVLEGYRTEIALCNDAIRSTPLEQAPAAWPDLFGDFRIPDLRGLLLHVIAETATHAGHLDAARELLDGGTWLVLT